MSRKILFIGWDAADWKVINDLIDRGRMPHTQALIERGTMGDLATLHPVLSPMLWATIATGKRPFKHGILGFTEPTPDGAGIQPVSQFGRTTKALWNILNQSGKRQHVIGWWPSHPVEPIRGVMVSNHFHNAIGPPDQPWPLAPGMVHPPEAAAALADCRINPNELLPEQVLPFVPLAAEIDQDRDRRLAGVMKLLAECASMHAAAMYALEQEPWDFLAVYYDAIDHFCHGYMKYRPPRRPHLSERDCELYGGVVDMAYEFHDQMLGAMLARVPADTTVIICSDHGFHPDHLRPVLLPKEPAGPAVEHRDLGMLILAGPGIRRDTLIHGASVLDITPTVLALYGLPVGEDMDGKVLVSAFEAPPVMASIPSWDAVAGDDARLGEEHRYDPIAAKEAMDQLIALGYVQAPGEDSAKAVAQTVRELRYNLARSYMDAGRHVDAVPVLADLYAAEPEQFRFGVQLALCYRALGFVPELRALVERLNRDRQAAAARARGELAALAEKLQARQAGAGELDPGGAIDPDRLGEDERRRYDELRLLAQCNSHDLDYLMGWVLTAEGQQEGALEYLRRAARMNAARPGLHIQIGETLLNLGRLEEAEDAFARALAIDPLSPHASLGQAKVRLRQRLPEDAVRLALHSIGRLYHNPLAHYVLAQALLRLGRQDRAAEALRVAIGINPNFEQAHRLLARHAARVERDWDGSLAHWRQVRECRRERRERRLARMADAQWMLESLTPETVLEVDQEGGRIGLDAPVSPKVDKSAVPARWQDCIVVVSGLPRTGTSMMMQLLAAGGIAPLTDGKRGADADNPRGYFEHEAATRLHLDRAWLENGEGRAVKVVATLLPYLPAGHAYRILFMERDPREMLKSQQTMLDRLGRERARLSDAQLLAAYRRQLGMVRAWLDQQGNLDVLCVGYRQVLDDPHRTSGRVAEFLGGGLATEAMAKAVDSALYRQRAAP